MHKTDQQGTPRKWLQMFVAVTSLVMRVNGAGIVPMRMKVPHAICMYVRMKMNPVAHNGSCNVKTQINQH